MRTFRFAPSPTGLLHIGGARTALFNWLMAQKTGGRLLLRIEDTDKERSTPENIQAILDGLEWLQIEADLEPVRQSANADRHREVAHRLLQAGKAYKCYATAEELKEMRETARKEGRPMAYDRRWRNRDPAEMPEDAPYAVRIKAPLEGSTVIDDLVQGRIEHQNRDLDDFVILRSDGTPTYMLAVVVDDHDMQVTDVIRGDDHLTNAVRQAVLYQALEWEMPSMAHIPLLHGADGGKLSKRHGAMGIGEYRAMGYLPEVMLNYFSMLGWREAGNEILTRKEMAARFDIRDVAKSPSRMDFKKLEDLNARAIREGDAVVLAHALAFGRIDLVQNAEFVRRLGRAMPDLQTKVRTLAELLDWADYLRRDGPIEPADDSAAALLDEPGVRPLLKDLADHFAVCFADEDRENWTEAELKEAMESYLEMTGCRMKDAAQPMRVALTGRLRSHGLYSIMYALGYDESLVRLRAAAEQ